MCLTSGCAHNNFDATERYFAEHNLNAPNEKQLQSCRGYGCKFVDEVRLNEEEWRTVEAPFKATAPDADTERTQIAQSIAAFEKIIGAKTGTEEDIGGTFNKLGLWQQDCVDESTNTSIYMMALQQRGHIKYHLINTPQSRLNFLRWPHQTAVITDKNTSERYAVDSWFHDNGTAPSIIEFEKWSNGWNPDDEA